MKIFIILVLAFITGSLFFNDPVFAGVGVPVTDFHELQSYMQDPGADYDIAILNDIEITDTITIPSSTTINLYSSPSTPVKLTISSSMANRRHITVNGNLTISEDTVTLNGGDIGGGILVSSSGTFTFTAGTIEHCRGDYGGGIQLTNNATFNMIGGAISNCRGISSDGSNYKAYGGAIHINTPTSSHTISGGTIAGCSAYRGGAIYVQNAVELKISGETIIQECDAPVFTETGFTSSEGGGIYVYSGTVIMTGESKVDTCSAANSGGGVFVASSGNFILGQSSSDTPKIIGCKVTSSGSGGGLYLQGKATINNGKITECRSVTNGGGAYVTGANGRLEMKGGEISLCTSGNGGGVFLSSNSLFNMSAGVISECNSTSNGGGVSMSNSTFNMVGSSSSNLPKIEKCTASANWSAGKGGGVFLNGTTPVLTINGGIIDNCKATLTGGPTVTQRFGSGGGIYLETSSAKCVLTDATISNCIAKYHGGAIFTRNYNQVTTTANTKFTGNTAAFYRLPANTVTAGSYNCTSSGQLSLTSAELKGRNYPLNNYDINYLSYVIDYYENARGSGTSGNEDFTVYELTPFETANAISNITYTIKQPNSIAGFTYYDEGVSIFKSWANAYTYVKYNPSAASWFTMRNPGDNYTFTAAMLTSQNESETDYRAHYLTLYALWQKELTIKKQSTGLFANLTKKFKIDANYRDGWYGLLPDTQSEFPMTFELKSGENAASYYVYEDFYTTIAEDANSAEGYTVKYEVNDGSGTKLNSFNLVRLYNYDQKEIVLTVHNIKADVPVTGLSEENSSMMTIVIAAGVVLMAGAITYKKYRKKRYR